MTALREYEKLEATGLWRETLETQRREVFVGFGNTSLMIRNKADEALSHWSLPAVQRLNPGQMPALYAPNSEASETLEIEDQTMVEAIEKVRTSIERRRPHPGRLRLAVFLGLTVTIAALGIFWLPGALERHTVGVVPYEKRLLIGQALLANITRLSGKPCETLSGAAAREKLTRRLFENEPGQLVIVPDGIAKSALLPGRFVLLNKALVEDFEGPEVVAGYVQLELARASIQDPLGRMLSYLGGLASFRLLTTGEVKAEDLRAYAQYLLTAPAPMPPNGVILARFKAAGFSSSPLAYEIDTSGETTLALIESDPYRNTPHPPLLSDSSWVSLQSICGG
jgi:hypothetical protein